METNTNTVKNTQGEELQNAIYLLYPDKDGEPDYTLEAEREAFAKGFNYLLPRYESLLHSHAELLDIVKGLSVLFYSKLSTQKMPDEVTDMWPLIKTAINNANLLTDKI